MEKNVQRYLEKRAEGIRNGWEGPTRRIVETYINSPIEQLFWIEMAYQIVWDSQQPKNCPNYYIMGQKKIATKNNNYKVDFLIYYTIDDRWRFKKKSKPEFHKDQALIIELDSYLWHGSEPEQFTKEKERERDLQKEGWKIMRFSGREIMQNTAECVSQVIAYFDDIKKRICKKGI